MEVVVAALKTLPGDPQSQSQVSACPQVGFRVWQPRATAGSQGSFMCWDGGRYGHGGDEMR